MTTILIIAGVILLAIGVTGASAMATKKSVKSGPGTWDHLFRTYSKYPDIAKAICRVESNYNPDAVGDSGRAHGLMQIWLPTAEGYGFEGNSADLMQPDVNIKYASRFLDDMIDKYGRDKGIMAYNLGETKIRRGVTMPSYLNKVNAAMA